MTNVRIALYNEAMELELKRASLQADMEEISSRLANIHGDLFRGDGIIVLSPTQRPTKRRSMRRVSSRPHSKRGELTTRIIGQLQAGGEQGAMVRDIASVLNVKPKNIFVWFATTGKKNKDIKKIGEGRYRLES